MYSEKITGICPKTKSKVIILVHYIPTSNSKNPNSDIKDGFQCSYVDPFKGQTCEFTGANSHNRPIFKSAPGVL